MRANGPKQHWTFELKFFDLQAISLMVDHYQFLFLLRLMDSIGHVGEKVLSDIATIFSTMPSNTTGE